MIRIRIEDIHINIAAKSKIRSFPISIRQKAEQLLSTVLIDMVHEFKIPQKSGATRPRLRQCTAASEEDQKNIRTDEKKMPTLPATLLFGVSSSFSLLGEPLSLLSRFSISSQAYIAIAFSLSQHEILTTVYIYP